ncbi:MAG TPA: ABC transporter permease [Dehalococcoidia bacterium]|nr:ABC transporter permease [Dehalococcoidia bacterium]
MVTEVLPGDAAQQQLGQSATPESLAALRASMGLDRPAYVRYFDWIGSALQGDLGESLKYKKPVAEVIGPRLYNSVILLIFAFVISVPTAVITGVWAGVRRNSFGDQFVSIMSLVGISLPEFVTGILFIVIFASWLDWLPSSSILLPGTSPLTRPSILVLPTLTMTGVLFAYIMRMTRANVIDVMETDYVRTAILKGLPMRRIIFRHIIPNAMLPTISVIAVNIGWMLGGLIIVENVFAYPGIGSLLLVAIVSRDVPMLQALSLIIAMTYAVSNLFADLSYGLLNPRIRIS